MMRSFQERLRALIRSRDGIALTEFALSLPVFLTLLMGGA